MLGRHGEQRIEPILLVTVPTSQRLQFVAFGLRWYWPVAQGIQYVIPDWFVDAPAEHAEQSSADSDPVTSLYEPDGHLAHLAKPRVLP